MIRLFLRPSLQVLVLLTVAVICLAFFALPVPQPTSAAGDQRLFLPLIESPGERLPSIFGVEMSRVREPSQITLISVTDTQWVRRNSLRWAYMEPTRGQEYNWTNGYTRQLEDELKIAAQYNLQIILSAQHSPLWAVTPYSVDCAPINPAYYQDFADFMVTAVARYSIPPYNVRYWEITNEPDAYVLPNDSMFGCWGLENDPYYGGRAYGELLKVVVPQMRAVNPNIIILNGGLLLNAPYDPVTGANHSARFLEGVFAVGAGDMIDMISYHQYLYYNGLSDDLTVNEDWKAAYLRDMMKRWQVAEKPLIKTETALLCRQITPECQWAQADAIGRIYSRGIRDKLQGVIWYYFNGDGYHNTGFFNVDGTPRPTYFAYRFATEMLNRSAYVGMIPDLPTGSEGYVFRRGNEQRLVAWANQAVTVPFTLPAGAQPECFNRDGGAIACRVSAGILYLELDRSPIYVRYALQ